MDLSDLTTLASPSVATEDVTAATDITAEAHDETAPDARWQLAWSHRPLLLSMARSRVSWHEAEDVVSEALLRSQHAADVPDTALRSWLVTTTLRLCADAHRSHARENRRRQRLVGHTLAVVPGPEDDVAERDQARWFADQVGRLPERQAQAIELRTEGFELGSIAGRMGLPYKAVESLLSRARRSLKGWAAVAIGIWSVSRFLTRRTAQLHVAAAVCCAAAGVASPLIGAATTVSEHGATVHRIAPANPSQKVLDTTPASPNPIGSVSL